MLSEALTKYLFTIDASLRVARGGWHSNFLTLGVALGAGSLTF